ncbi:hypothetical protein D7V80_22840 [Corallococcus sp. CA054B]|nr:hypothetical protein D7V80_22840 [Corallococcus sp. CA054B]
MIRLLILLLALSPVGVWAAPFCTPGTSENCVNYGGCVGTRYCGGAPGEPRGEWGECFPSGQPQACSACGAGGTATCVDGEYLGPCQPSTAQAQDICGNGCDEDRDGEADEGCAGSRTFDYCEPNPNGSGFTRWTCGCGNGLNVGYCLGSGDSQASCSSPGGCLKAPAFGTTGAPQAGGNYQCCVSSKPCSSEGYVNADLKCTPFNTPSFECTPGASCDDSNACGNTCAGVAPQVDRTTGVRTTAGAYCSAGPVCGLAQGGFGASNSGVSASRAYERCGTADELDDDGNVLRGVITCFLFTTESPTDTLPVGGPYERPDRNGRGGGLAGDGRGGGIRNADLRKGPAPNTCGPASGSVVRSAVSAMSTPSVGLGDFTTRHTEADLGLQGALGGFNFVRRYVSTEKYWAYQSMLGSNTEPFVAKPFGTSPGSTSSLRWWHSLYSFVMVKGMMPGVSTWAVRDTNGDVLEFSACSSTGAGCFATPRATSRWSDASLFWTGSSFILTRPGDGRYIYASPWAANGVVRRHFLTRVEEFRPGGTPRVRLSLEYAPQSIGQYGDQLHCPGQSSTNNGVPFLTAVTTEEGSKMRLYYRRIYSRHPSVGEECVLDRLSLHTDPNSYDPGNRQNEVTVAQYRYPTANDEYGSQLGGLLSSVEYPETGDVVNYTDTTGSGAASTSWAVAMNQTPVASHVYQSGKITTMSSGVSAMSMSLGSGDCDGPQAQEAGSNCVPPAAEPASSGSAGDAAGTTVQFRRRFFAKSNPSTPYTLLSSYVDDCVTGSGNCTGFSPGYVSFTYETPADGSLFLRYMRNKAGTFDHTQRTYSTAGSNSRPGVVSPVQQESGGVGQTISGTGGVAKPTTSAVFANYPANASSSPWKPVQQSVETIASVLQPSAQATTRTVQDEVTGFRKAVIRSGYTQRFDDVAGTFSGPVLEHRAVFFFNHLRCLGESDTGGTLLKEVHGPCAVSGPEATDCSGTDFPITQYQYYGPASGPPSENYGNTANRLKQVVRYLSHGGAQSCAGAPSLITRFDRYDARGNPTQVTLPESSTAALRALTFQRSGGRLESVTAQGLTSQYFYEGPRVRAIRHPTGDYTVSCYRSGTPAGQGCTGGLKTQLLQWTAVANDVNGVDWSEKRLLTYWPDGIVKTEEMRTRRNGVEESRRLITHHPDPHHRPTYTRMGEGAGSFGAVAGFDVNNNRVAIGRPFNDAPDFCRTPGQTGTGISELCTSLGYDTADRLTTVSKVIEDGSDKQTSLSYDAQGHIKQVHRLCPAGTSGACRPLANYQYDDFGKLIELRLPHATGFVQQDYDVRGNLRIKQSAAMRAAGEWVEYAHDLVGRALSSTRRLAGSGTPEVLFQFGYDADGTLPALCGDPELKSKGQLRYRDDSFGRTWYRYDTEGRLVAELRQRQGDTVCSPELETRYTYDTLGRFSGVLHPYGRAVQYIYGTGALARRVSAIDVTWFPGTGIETRRMVSDIVWEPFGGLRGYQITPAPGLNPVSVEYALGDNGTVAPSGCGSAFPSASSSDRTGRLRSLRVSSGAFTPGVGSGDIYKKDYTWHADQIVRTDTCLLGGPTPRTELFDYDRDLRLKSAQRPSGNVEAAGGAFDNLLFSYDTRDNRKTLTGNLTVALSHSAGLTSGWLMSATPSHDDFQTVAYDYDADGRAVRKEAGLYTSGSPANVLELGYGPFNASEGQGSARETVFRAVRVNGLTYNYYYDAFGRRRAKVNPFGLRDEFFHSVGSELLVDQGWSDVTQGSFQAVDDYVWLGGKPVVMLRGRVDATTHARQSDFNADCRRNGEAASCGAYFPVVDLTGRPVLMLDGIGKVAGAADYQPFGHVNRFTLLDPSQHPYSDADGETISAFVQQPDNSQVKVRMRGLFQFVDMQDDEDDTDEILLRDADSNAVLAVLTGPQQGRWVTQWVPTSAGRVYVNISAGEQGAEPNAFTGAAVEGYEYQRYQVGASPFWTPLRGAGQYYDAETDFFENWNRYYDPSIGRYLQPEPALQSPGYLADMVARGYDVPAYSYALNNPMIYTDPNGLWVLGVGVSGAFQFFTGMEASVHVTVDTTGRMALMITPGVRVGLDYGWSVSPNVFVSSAPTVDSLRGYGTNVTVDCPWGSFSMTGAMDLDANKGYMGGAYGFSEPALGTIAGFTWEGTFSYVPVAGQVFPW